MQKAEQINLKDALLSKYLSTKKSYGKKNFKGKNERIAKQEKEIGQMDRLRLLLNILKFILREIMYYQTLSKIKTIVYEWSDLLNNE